VAALIQMGCYNVNAGDIFGHTPLVWAAQNGHEEVVKILLERGGVPIPTSQVVSVKRPFFMPPSMGPRE